MTEPAKVVLRDAHDGADHRHLEVYDDAAGDLHIDGQDLGPGTAPVSDDGEYEWFQVVRAEHVSILLRSLGASTEQPVLVALRAAGADTVEQALRSGIIPVERQVWGG